MVNIIPYPKAQHSAPKMEDIKEGEVMAITLNPIKEHDPTRPIMQFITSQYNYLMQHAESGGYRLLLYPEASPLARLHFHGYIVIDNIINWITKGCLLLKDLNSFAIKKFFKREKNEDEDDEHTDGQETWQKYCTKQNHIFKPLFDRTVLDYPISIRFNKVEEGSEEEEGSGTEGSAPPPPPSSSEIKPRTNFKNIIENKKTKIRKKTKVQTQSL